MRETGPEMARPRTGVRRNYAIDELKLLCAVLVVLIHTSGLYARVDNPLYDFINPMLRCAVPCFFMVSGYLLFNGHEIGAPRLRRNLMNVLGITAWTSVLFVVVREAAAWSQGGLVFPTWSDCLCFLLGNFTPFGYHLWYLYAYIYVLLIVWAVERYGRWQWLFAAAPLLLAGNLLWGEWGDVLFGIKCEKYVLRNFLFTGLPFFSLGAWLKTQESRWRVVNRRWFAGG